MMTAFRNILLFFGILLLSGCTVQLVPDYDEVLVERLDKANTETLTLFAAVEEGSPKFEFAKHEETYVTVIGEFDALRQRAANRQIPPLAKRISKLSIVKDFCNSKGDPTGCVNASPGSLQSVLDILRKMRTRHRTSGLEPDTVGLFRTGYETAIGQALTVEAALQR